MADSPLDKALKRRAELANEIKEIDQFVALYNRFSETKREQQEPAQESRIQPERSLPAPKRKRKKAGPADIARVAGDAIRDAKRPLTRSDLVSELEARGLTLDSKDKPRYVGTILWRLKEKFINLEGYGYWLKDDAYGPAGYIPSIPQPAAATPAPSIVDLVAKAMDVDPHR